MEAALPLLSRLFAVAALTLLAGCPAIAAQQPRPDGEFYVPLADSAAGAFALPPVPFSQYIQQSQPATTLAPGDYVPVIHNGVTERATVSQFGTGGGGVSTAPCLGTGTSTTDCLGTGTGTLDILGVQ